MNIIHSKTVKFINAITSHDARENDATQTSEVTKYQPAYIRQVPVAMLQQMFEVTAKIRSWSLKVKPMFTRKRRLLPGNVAHVYTVACGHSVHAC